MVFFSRTKAKELAPTLQQLMNDERKAVHISTALQQSTQHQMHMIQLTAEDLAILRVMRPALQSNLDSIVEKFYQNLEKESSLGDIIAKHSSVSRLSNTLRSHIGEMFDGVIDEQYLQKRYKIAEVHARIGLAPKWYMSAFQDLLNGFFVIVSHSAFTQQEQYRIILAVSKILNLEQQIVLESYEEQYQHSLYEENARKDEMMQEIIASSAQLQQIVSMTDGDLQAMNAVLSHLTTRSEQNVDMSDQLANTASVEKQRVHDTEAQGHTLLQTMEQIQSQVGDLYTLNEEITNIAKLITGIADQTNLLALNASIEAARAGEHGKGFAVVADEVSKLAEQSKQSANAIKQLTADIQADTDNVARAVDHSLASVQDGVNIIGEARQSFETISNSISEMTAQIEDVSATSEQLSAGAQQVSASIQDISNGAAQSAQNIDVIVHAIEDQMTTMQQVTSVATDLSQSAQNLYDQIKMFKV